MEFTCCNPGNTDTHDLAELASAIADRIVENDQAVRLVRAINLAVHAHFLQRDKAGEVYVFHPLRVGISLLPDVDAAIIGVLHDVIEDCPEVSRDEILHVLDGDAGLYQDLLAVTQEEDEPYLDYILRCAERPRAVKVKLADIKDNLNPRRFAAAIKVTDPNKLVTLHQKYVNAEWILNHIAN